MDKITKMLPIAITIGDPSGIGPEIVAKSLNTMSKKDLENTIAIGHIESLLKAAKSLNSIKKVSSATLIDTSSSGQITPCAPSVEGGEASYRAIVKAVELARNKTISAIVTAPISKDALHLAGYPFDGHTGLIAELCGVKDPYLLLYTKRFSVVHTSAHLSLVNAIKMVKKDRILKVIIKANQYLKNIKKRNIKIAVSGLNPHSGENGLFGDEEINEIIPAIKNAQKIGLNIEGPIVPDTLFRVINKKKYDLIVVQYHDQGHIPMKLLAFDEAVNITLGIPIIRTSVDHGTAFDIAWKNQANHYNLLMAIKCAKSIVSV